MSLVSRIGATLVRSSAALSHRPPSSFAVQEAKMAASLKRSYARSAEYETLKLSDPMQYVVEVEVNSSLPDTMNSNFWREFKQCFAKLGEDSDCRVVLLTGKTGLDVIDFAVAEYREEQDVARKAMTLMRTVKSMQGSFTELEKCLKPVIAVIQGACVGGGVDMISACDVRICSKDAYFQMRELDVSVMCDVGTLQRLPKLISNDSLLREFVYTARKFSAEEAMGIGMVSDVHESQEDAKRSALELARVIASKSPVAVQGLKRNLLFSRDHPVDVSLDYAAVWNSAMLQTEDIQKAVQATILKETPVFSKL